MSQIWSDGFRSGSRLRRSLTMTVGSAAVFAPRSFYDVATLCRLGLGLGLGLGGPWVTQASPKGDPSVTQGPPKDRLTVGPLFSTKAKERPGGGALAEERRQRATAREARLSPESRVIAAIARDRKSKTHTTDHTDDTD